MGKHNSFKHAKYDQTMRTTRHPHKCSSDGTYNSASYRSSKPTTSSTKKKTWTSLTLSLTTAKCTS